METEVINQQAEAIDRTEVEEDRHAEAIAALVFPNEIEPQLKLQKYKCPVCRQAIQQGQRLETDTTEEGHILGVLHEGCKEAVDVYRTLDNKAGIANYLKKAEPTDNYPPAQLVTLNEWLESEGLNLDKSEKHRLAAAVSKKYQEETGLKPRTVIRTIASGKFANKAKGYRPEHLDILKKAYAEITS
ncbi:hypothetical protein ACE1B6_24105 [Aerosakkonemataceae cyanobacterium BLCC-F154]|uniref:Uncharacterized protein n=1 Tax=Floridaenema fluviatile BLCC-F154 TaxID=3153640 RepID=A0ABV4YHN0_9CYAN